MGPLAWSIILFRNSMIFHSLDKVRSGSVEHSSCARAVCAFARRMRWLSQTSQLHLFFVACFRVLWLQLPRPAVS